MKFVVDLWLDGVDDDPEGQAQEEACMEFIKDQLDMTASSVKVERYIEKKEEVEKEKLKIELLEKECSEWKTENDIKITTINYMKTLLEEAYYSCQTGLMLNDLTKRITDVLGFHPSKSVINLRPL